MFLGKLDAFHVNDDAEIKPVNLLVNYFEPHGGGHRVRQQRLELVIHVDGQLFRELLGPLRKFFRELPGNAGLESAHLGIIGEAHFFQQAGNGIEVLPDEAQQGLVFHGLLVSDVPAVLAEFFRAVAGSVPGAYFTEHVLRFRGGEAADNLHVKGAAEVNVHHAVLHAGGKGSADLAQEFHPFKAVDDLLGNGIAGFHFRALQPAGGAREHGFVRLVQLLLAGKLADGVGDVDAGGRGELEGVAVRLNGVVLANPLERFVHHLEIIFIQVHQVAFQGGLVEKLVHQGARGFLVQVQRQGVFRTGVIGQGYKEDFRLGIHAHGSAFMQVFQMFQILLFPDGNPVLLQGMAVFEMALVDGGNEPHEQLSAGRLRGSFIHGLDAVIPSAYFTGTLPFVNLALNFFQVRDGFHEFRVGQAPLVEGVGDVIPEFKDVRGRHGPQFQRVIADDFPAGIQAHHVMVMDFLLNGETAVALLQLADVIRFLVIQFAAQLLFQNIQQGNVVKFVRGLRKILAAVHAFQHGGVHGRSGQILVFRGASPEPPVALEAEVHAVYAVRIFHTALNIQMIAKDLRNRSVFLELLAAQTDFFRKGIEKVQGSPIRVKCHAHNIRLSYKNWKQAFLVKGRYRSMHFTMAQKAD